MPDYSVAPGAVAPVLWPLGDTGIAASLTYKVKNEADETVFYAASNTGIAERDAGVYSIHAFTFPTTAGSYVGELYENSTLVWTDAIQVTSTAFVPGSPSGSDLTTIAQVKNWLGITDSSQDTRLQQLVTAASSAVVSFAQRQFAPIQASTTYAFPLLANGLIRFGKHDLQSATLVQLDTDGTVTATTIDPTQYLLEPVNAPNGVYTQMRFYSFAVGPVIREAYGIPRVVSVTGTWGWPAIPPDVEQATIVTVAKWYRRDQVAWASELPEPALSDGLNLPYDARVLLAPFKRPL